MANSRELLRRLDGRKGEAANTACVNHGLSTVGDLATDFYKMIGVNRAGNLKVGAL
jgi:hypothetical protein